MTTIKTIGGKGPLKIEIEGLTELITRLRLAGHNIKYGEDIGVVDAGNFIVEELAEAIAGNRPAVSVKSVDTGLFLSSIQFERTGEGRGFVHSIPKIYPNSNTTTQDVTVFMEFGTSKNPIGRYHFRNTAKVNIDKVKEIIKTRILAKEKLLK